MAAMTPRIHVNRSGLWLQGAPAQKRLFAWQMGLFIGMVLAGWALAWHGTGGLGPALLKVVVIGAVCWAGNWALIGWLSPAQRCVARLQDGGLELDLCARAPGEPAQRLCLAECAEISISADQAWLHVQQRASVSASPPHQGQTVPQLQVLPLCTVVNGQLLEWAVPLRQWLVLQATELQQAGVQLKLELPPHLSPCGAGQPTITRLRGWAALRGGLQWGEDGVYSQHMPRNAQLESPLQALAQGVPDPVSAPRRTAVWCYLPQTPLAYAVLAMLLEIWALALVLGRDAPELAQAWSLPGQPWPVLWALLGWLRWASGTPLIWLLVWAWSSCVLGGDGVRGRLLDRLYPRGFALLELRGGVLTVATSLDQPLQMHWQLSDIAHLRLRLPSGLLRDTEVQLGITGHGGATQWLYLRWPHALLRDEKRQQGRTQLLQLLRRQLGERLVAS